MAKLTSTASGMLTTNPSHACASAGQRMVKSRAPTMVGATPRESRWYAARPRSAAAYQRSRLTGR